MNTKWGVGWGIDRFIAKLLNSEKQTEVMFSSYILHPFIIIFYLISLVFVCFYVSVKSVCSTFSISRKLIDYSNQTYLDIKMD